MDIRRGEIYFIKRSDNFGCEIESGRPAIIVSNEMNNRYSEVAEVVYLTTQPKREMPTHVQINATGITSTALCEQIHSVSADRIGDWKATCSANEMKQVDIALMTSLGIESPDAEKQEEQFSTNLLDKLNKAESELKVYQKLYSELLERVMKH